MLEIINVKIIKEIKYIIIHSIHCLIAQQNRLNRSDELYIRFFNNYANDTRSFSLIGMAATAFTNRSRRDARRVSTRFMSGVVSKSEGLTSDQF